MRVLVTGASGFIGAHLVRRLLELGVEVRGTYRNRLPAIGGIDWCPLTQLNDPEQWSRLLTDVEMVVHLAALAHQIDRRHSDLQNEYQRVNVEGTRLVAQASRAAGVQRLVFMSSIAAVCSRSELTVDDATQPHPQDDYGRTKLAGENALQSALAGGRTDWCILRPPLIYGPGNPGNMQRLLNLIGTGWPLPFGSIDNRRSFMHVDNLVDAIVTVLRYPNAIRTAYVLGDGSDFSTAELVTALARATGRTPRLLRVPVGVLRLLARAGDLVGHVLGKSPGVDSYSVERLVSSLVVNSQGFSEFFSWQPPLTAERAIRATCSSAPGS